MVRRNAINLHKIKKKSVFTVTGRHTALATEATGGGTLFLSSDAFLAALSKPFVARRLSLANYNNIDGIVIAYVTIYVIFHTANCI